MDQDFVRKVIDERLAALAAAGAAIVSPQGSTGYEGLSELLGKNKSYVQQFMRHKQQALPLPARAKLAEVLGVPASILVADYELPVVEMARGAFEEDAAPYQGPHSASEPGTALWVATSNALEMHRLRIVEGDVLVFDITQQAVDKLVRHTPDPRRPDPIVLVQLYDKKDLMKATTVVRQYIHPGQLVTNRRSFNQAFYMHDEALQFEPRVKGVLSYVRREA